MTLTVRLTPDEAELVRETASKAETSVAGLIRYALLDQKPPRATRKPSLSRRDAAQILGMIGKVRSDLDQAASSNNAKEFGAYIQAAHGDLADMRFILMSNLGFDP